MRNLPFLRIFLLLGLCTVYLFSFSHLGVLAYEFFVVSENKYSAGTTVATIDLSNTMKEDAAIQIETAVEAWSGTTVLPVRYREKQGKLPMEVFEFNINDTMVNVRSGEQNGVTVNVNTNVLKSYLISLLGQAEAERFDLSKLINDLQASASMLAINPKGYQLEKYVPDEFRQSKALTEAVVPVGNIDMPEVTAWVSQVKQVEIQPHARFSMLDTIKENGLSNLSNDSLSLIASAIYKAILNTNFTVLERHTSRELPKGAELGFEARVVTGKLDLLVFNPNYTAYVLEFNAQDNKLSVILKGEPLLYEYRAWVSETKKFAPKTIVRYSNSLHPSEKKLLKVGKKGMLVKVYRKVSEGGSPIKSVLIAEDFYPPIHTIESRGYPAQEEQEGVSGTEVQNQGENQTVEAANQPSQSTNRNSAGESGSGSGLTEPEDKEADAATTPISKTKE